MPHVRSQISMSLDGDVAGPEQSLESPLGTGGMRPHERVLATDSPRARHGTDGGDDGAGDEVRRGWWGDEPRSHFRVFVLTHSATRPLDELRLHTAPGRLGAGERRLDGVGDVEPAHAEVRSSPAVTYLADRAGGPR